MSSFSYIPLRRDDSKEQTYFNSAPKTKKLLTYDQLFRQGDSYDEMLHRDDRVHAKGRGLAIHEEESSRPVAVLSSSEYGRRFPSLLYKPGCQFDRVATIGTEFFRKNGVSWCLDDGYGSIVPV
ncbi:uncharacterized protein C5orf49 [Scleropages formosus]|nr:uncharacterized protein C5orf49 homolog [Scleropages formosus]